MKRTILAAVAALCLSSLAAEAGSVVITAGPTATQRTRTWTLNDSVFAARILPALKWHFGQICTTTTSGTPPVSSTTCVDRTNAEAFDAFSLGVEQAMRDIVKRYEVQQGRTTSDAAVTVLP
jgi:hypothetical protein